MSSINFNSAANQALRTLQATNASLDATQKSISTGLKIGEAKDNAAYWSISTTLKSDNKALSTVSDALGLGAATVDVAYQGLNAAKSVLDEIKTKLTAASQSGVDKDKINAEIVQLKQQLDSIAASSTFSGENWLTGANGIKEVVSSFNRGANNAITIGTIGINTNQVALKAAGAGILDTSSAVAVNSFTATNTFDFAAAITFDGDDSLTFTVTQGAAPVQVSVTQATVNSALGTAAAGKISSGADLVAVMNKALMNAQITGVTASVNAAGDSLVFTGNTAFTIGSATADDGANNTIDANLTAAKLGVANGAATGAAAVTASVSSISIDATTTKAQIEAMIKIVSTATDKVITQAANLGAVASRIELQKSFVATMMDTIDKGVSGLVDADMNEESTKLQALQVKQQLGVQALSIANQSAQNVLRLFQ